MMGDRFGEEKNVVRFCGGFWGDFWGADNAGMGMMAGAAREDK